MSLCRHLRALNKSLVSLHTCRLYSLVLIPCNGEWELSAGDQGQVSCCHLTAGCSPELFCEPSFLQDQCHPHLRDTIGEYFKSYHGLERSHDLVQIGCLHFFVCSWVLAGTWGPSRPVSASALPRGWISTLKFSGGLGHARNGKYWR